MMQGLDMDDLEQRIRDRAYRIWVEEGRPEGRANAHWEMARELIAIEANQKDATKPNPANPGVDRAFHEQPVEQLEAVENQGEFPTLTDQGEGQASRQKGRRRRRS